MEKERESAATVKGRRGTREERRIWERSRRRAEGRWWGRFRTTLPGHWDWGETHGNCFLIKGGRVRATNDYCFKYAGKWQTAKECEEMFMCATKGVIPTPKVAHACTSLACYVALSGTMLHVLKCAWLHEVQRVWVYREVGGADVRCSAWKKKQLSCFIYDWLYFLSFMFCVEKNSTEVSGLSKMCRLHGTEKAQHILLPLLSSAATVKPNLEIPEKINGPNGIACILDTNSHEGSKLISNSEMKMAARP